VTGGIARTGAGRTVFMPPPHHREMKTLVDQLQWQAALPAPALRIPCSCRHLIIEK
jgi:hypothetical protein